VWPVYIAVDVAAAGGSRGEHISYLLLVGEVSVTKRINATPGTGLESFPS
jgi:hypothetical protein